MGLAAIVRNITERKRNEAPLVHNALHDALTKLPNRALFLEHLQSAIDRNARLTAANFAVLFIDLDRFKIINDSLGHMEGDKLLIAIAQRLRAALRPRDIVARLGGDEFTILLDGLETTADALHIVERLESISERANQSDRPKGLYKCEHRNCRQQCKLYPAGRDFARCGHCQVSCQDRRQSAPSVF